VPVSEFRGVGPREEPALFSLAREHAVRQALVLGTSGTQCRIQMTGVLIVFVADVLGHIEISFEIRSSIDDPGSGQCAGILDGDLHFHVP